MNDDWFTAKDNAHLAALGSLSGEAGDSLGLAGASVAHLMIPLALTNIPSDALFSNAVAGTACFSLAHRLLRASLLLLHFGYYESIAPLLRSGYEAAGCGQYLSKNPDAAHRWIDRATYWPRNEVRDRLGGVTRSESYGRHYGFVSSLSHPTARAAMDSLSLNAEHVEPMLFREIDAEKLRYAAVWLAGTAVFACFALQNANPEDSIEPSWLRRLAELATAVSDAAGVEDADWSHLDRDWEASQTHWQKIVDRLQANEELERALNEHPASWRRALRDLDEAD